MPSVLISSRSFTDGPKVAEEVARRLGHELLTEDDLCDDAARRFSVPRDALRAALSKPPALLGMSDAERRRLVRFLLASLWSSLLRDGIVYRGPFGPLFVGGVSHVVRVLVTAPMAQRVDAAMRDDGSSEARARRRVERDDEAAQRIARAIGGVEDSTDRYDVVLEAALGRGQDAVNAIVARAGGREFQPMSFSLECVRDGELGHRIAAQLAAKGLEATVEVNHGAAKIRVRSPRARGDDLKVALEREATGEQGIREAHVELVDDLFGAIAASMR